MENPKEVSANQIKVLEEEMGSETSRTLFRLAGIDLEELAAFLEAAPAKQEEKTRRA